MLLSKLRKSFLTGLAVMLPLLVTVYIVMMIFSIVGSPLGRIFALFHLPGPLATLAGFASTVLIIALVGFLATNIFGQQLVRLMEMIFNRLPLVRKIYNPTRQLVQFMFSSRTETFRKVAMVEYPRKGMYTIGFVTGESVGEVQHKTAEDVLSIFLPTTPNPTSGWLAMVPRSDVIMLDMTVEDGLKLIVSGGVLAPEWMPGERTAPEIRHADQTDSGYEPSTLMNRA